MTSSREPKAQDVAPPGQPSVSTATAGRALAATLVVLAVFLVVVYPQGLQGPFMADDFVFLEKARHLSFGEIWKPANLPFHYWRPWSRELQYWLWPRLFGPSEMPFHVLSFVLCFATLGLFFSLVQRIAGTWAAGIATAGVAALTPWAALLLWVAGIQDLWMLACALAALVAFAAGRRYVSAAFFLVALLSKETAAVVPAIVLLYARVVERHRWSVALRRTIPFWLLLVAWAAVHPELGGRIGDEAEFPAAGSPAQAPRVLLSTLLALFNLDRLPHPIIGWPVTILSAFAGILPLAALLVWLFRTRSARSAAEVSEVRNVLFGLGWFAIAATPVALLGAGWHSYYATFGMMGAWLALGVWLARRRWIAIPLIAALVIVRTGRATTLSSDWGSEWYQARAAIFMLGSRDYFQSRPPFPKHARIYLSQVPGAIGMVPGGKSIVMQVWMRDTTLSTFYESNFAPRAPGEPKGEDFFFSYHRENGWVEDPIPVVTDTSKAGEREDYALRLSRLNRVEESLAEFLRLAQQHPDQPGYFFNVASCYYRMGDSVEAAHWYQKAAALPGAPEAMKQIAAQTRHLLPREAATPEGPRSR